MVSDLPLAGTRVVDLTRFVSGSYATMLLAGWGAEVVKVELPDGGDPYRAQGAHRIGDDPALFLALNGGKRSVALDFRAPRCRDLVEKLLASADFLVENGKPGSLAPYGLDYEAVHARHPQLVYGSISGFGQRGPDAARGGFDLILQAEGGIMSVTGSPEAGPVKVGVPVLDVGAAVLCVAGLLAAHVERVRSGIGRHVTTSLLEFALAAATTVAAGYFASGDVPAPLGTHSPTFAPYGGFRTSDEMIVLAGSGSEHLWQRLCEVLDRPDLYGDARFADNASRVRHRDALTAELEATLREGKASEWVERLERAGVPAGMVKDLGAVLDGAQAAALGIVQTLTRSGGVTYRTVGLPVDVGDAGRGALDPAPALGAHTAALLTDLGARPEELDELADLGLVRIP